MFPGASLSGRVTGRPGSRKQEASRDCPEEEEDIVKPSPSGGRPHRARACPGGTSFHRIGRLTRRPPRAGLEGSLLEGLRPSQHHEGGARAPLGGMLQGTFPSGGHRARSAHRSGVHHQDHSGASGSEGRARRPLLAQRDSTSRRGWWAARLHRRARVQPSHVSGAPLAFAHGALRGSTSRYVRMPFGLPNAVAAQQRLLRSILEAQEVRHCAVLAEMEMVREEPPAPPEPPEAPGPGGS